jgi:hypothetical protein
MDRKTVISRRMKFGSVEPYSLATSSFEMPMLDKPEKTFKLISALEMAVPFEAELSPALIKLLKGQNPTLDPKPRQIVSKISYAGDEGGIVCHLEPGDGRDAVIVSLTHLRLKASLPYAAAILDYQKHRLKKLKKQNGTT